MQIKKTSYDIKDCRVKATLVNGDKIEIPYIHMRYDSADEIYWYKDQSLSNIEILGPDGNPQTQFSVFE